MVLPDGAAVLSPLPPDFNVQWDDLARSDADLVARELSLTLRSGDIVTIDLGWPGGGRDPTAGKPVVYLDQNHWVALAQATHCPDRLDKSVREAALALITLAESRDVVLPFSSGHLSETAPYGRQRRDVALTMLRLSRGLQMRNPLHVRQEELSAAMRQDEPRCASVFTLEPDVLFAAARPTPSPADFSSAWRQLHRRVTSASATIAVMLEDDDHRALPTAVDRWVRTYAEVASRVQAEKPGRDARRSIAHGVLLADLQDELINSARAAGLHDSDLAQWIVEQAAADFERAPYLGTLQDVLFHRLGNRDDHWKPNDLFDMYFLSCAAGYADVVVAEKKFGDYLGRARRRHPGNALVVSSLLAATRQLR